MLFLASLSCLAGEEPVTTATIQATEWPVAVWTSLKYEASGAAGNVSTSLDLSASSAGEMQSHSHTALETLPIQNPPSRIMQLVIHGRAQSLFGNSGTRGRIWFDPDSGAVLQNDRLRQGKKPSHKLYRFGLDGAFRIRLDPENRAEAQRPSSDWTTLKESFYPYDPAAAGCEMVSHPALLLYLAANRDFQDNRRVVEICVFRDGGLYRVRLDPAGNETLVVDYALHRGGTTMAIGGLRDTLKLTLGVEPVSPGADPGDFELLELRGAIAIHLDTITGVPVRITGERSMLGRIGIGLVEAVVRD